MIKFSFGVFNIIIYLKREFVTTNFVLTNSLLTTFIFCNIKGYEGILYSFPIKYRITCK